LPEVNFSGLLGRRGSVEKPWPAYGPGQLFRRTGLLRSGFFGNAVFGISVSHGFGFNFDGFGFTIAFGFNGFSSHFSFDNFSLSGRFTCERDPCENESGSSASKQFRHWRFPLFDTLPGGLFRGPAANAH
jgi:hypothetical protein